MFSLPLSFSFFTFFSLPFSLHILSGCCKSVNYGQSLELGLWSIMGIVGHFATICALKLILFFNLLHHLLECCRKPSHRVDRAIVVLLPAYQDDLVTFKVMTSQVVQRAYPLSMCICVLGSQRVKILLTQIIEQTTGKNSCRHNQMLVGCKLFIFKSDLQTVAILLVVNPFTPKRSPFDE